MTQRIPLEKFFRNPEKTNYKISPDGLKVAWLAPFENRMNIHFAHLTNLDAVERLTDVVDRDIKEYFWGNDNNIVYAKDENGNENFNLYGINVLEKKLTALTPFPDCLVNIIDKLRSVPNEILIGINKREKQIFDPYRLNIETGELKLITENPGNISSWFADHNGDIKAATQTDGVNSSFLYRENTNDEFKTILTTNFKENIFPLFFSFDNKYIYAASNLNRDKIAIVKVNPATGEELEIIFEHKEVDSENLSYSKKRKKLLAVSFITWKLDHHFLDDEIKNIYQKITSNLPNQDIHLVSVDDEENRFIVKTESDKSKGKYYYYDVALDSLTFLAEVADWLNEDDLSEMKPISYQTSDGLTINGYLTIPNGGDGKNLPVVVNPHGGPWSRDVWQFNSEVQFLANRGYAVFQMNFRSSTGYGNKFFEAGFKQWGKKMQDDITEGVQWLVEKGIADANRIAIYGGSYGGYATLAGLTFTPKLYACGIDFVGVSNIFTFMETIPPYWKPYLDMMYEMVGHPEEDKELLTSASPVFHVDKIEAPLFVAQGANDPRVKIDESDQIVNALKDRGIEVEYMVKENEGHGFHNQENKFDFYRAMEKFLNQHIGNKNV